MTWALPLDGESAEPVGSYSELTLSIVILFLFIFKFSFCFTGKEKMLSFKR